VSLERLELEGAVARYRHKRAKRPAEELFDPQDLLARLLMHITFAAFEPCTETE
jgi:hypothetical protein